MVISEWNSDIGRGRARVNGYRENTGRRNVGLIETFPGTRGIKERVVACSPNICERSRENRAGKQREDRRVVGRTPFWCMVVKTRDRFVMQVRITMSIILYSATNLLTE